MPKTKPFAQRMKKRARKKDTETTVPKANISVRSQLCEDTASPAGTFVLALLTVFFVDAKPVISA